MVAGKAKRIITPSQRYYDINIIEKNINKELEFLRGKLETFLKNPGPLPWVPPDYVVLNREFLTNLRLATYHNGNPSLLFHDLDACDDDEIRKIFGVDDQPLCAIITCPSNPSHHAMQVYL